MVKQYISVEPERVNFVRYEGDKVKEKVTITSFEEQPLKITDITCDNEDKIKYKLKTKEKGKEYILEIKNRSKQAGPIRGKIELKTNSVKKPLLVIYVSGKLVEEVIATPSTLSFGNIYTTRKGFEKRLKKTIRVNKVRGDGLTIKKVKTSSDWILTETKTQKEGKQYTILITLDEDKLPKGKFEERIDIHTNSKKKSLVVYIKGKVI